MQKLVGVTDAAVFLVDTAKLRHPDDLKADMEIWVHKSIHSHSLGPRPKTNPSVDQFQYCGRGRKGLVDLVHIPKDSLPLIQTC